jgi:uncharacterized metal-binding protein
MSESNGGSNVLIYACSGGANVAEAADRAARQMMAEGRGRMFCLAGIGAGIAPMIDTARQAEVNLVIDGCPTDCAAKVFAQRSITNVRHVRVTDLGINKQGKGVRCTDDEVRCVAAAGERALQR